MSGNFADDAVLFSTIVTALLSQPQIRGDFAYLLYIQIQLLDTAFVVKQLILVFKPSEGFWFCEKETLAVDHLADQQAIIDRLTKRLSPFICIIEPDGLSDVGSLSDKAKVQK